MRCAWCSWIAEYNLSVEALVPPHCHRHLPQGREIFNAFRAWHPGPTLGWWGGPHHVETLRLRADVIARDARELRGEPPSMEGWVLFDGSAS